VTTTLGAVRLMRSILFNVSPTDPMILVGMAGVLATLTLLGAYLPTRATGRVDPAALLHRP
jgi:hypothetical protein